jgi:hypothetical protein
MKVVAHKISAMLSVIISSNREKPLVFVDAINSCLGAVLFL